MKGKNVFPNKIAHEATCYNKLIQLTISCGLILYIGFGYEARVILTCKCDQRV